MSESRFLVKAAIIVGSGGLIFGYDIGVISGTLSRLTEVFNLSGYEQGLVVSILNAGSIVGCLFGGPLCDVLGRWRTIQVQNAIFIIGALTSGLATDLATLCAGRFLVGVASSISGLADVPYLTEIAPAEYRGVLSGQYEILVALGVLVSFCLDLAFSTFSEGWRVAFIVPAGLALLQSAGLFLLPESPKWLMAKGHLNTARSALVEIYGETRMQAWIEQDRVVAQEVNCQEEQKSIGHSSLQSKNRPISGNGHTLSASAVAALNSVQSCPSDVQLYLRLTRPAPVSTYIPSLLTAANSNTSGSNSHRKPAGADVELSRHITNDASLGSDIMKPSTFGLSDEEKAIFRIFQYPIIMIIIIQLLSQSATVIRNYAPIIFEESGASTQLSLTLNIVLGVVKLFFTTVAVFRIEEQGRRGLMLVGIIIVCAGLAFLMLASAVSKGGNLHSATLFIIGCSAIYAGFGCGYGPVPWIISAEMVPPIIRARIMSVSLIASNVSQLVAGLIFVPMNEGITSTGGFGVFLILNLINFFYIYLFLTETKDVTPEVILDDLERRYEHICGRTFANSQRDRRRRTTSMSAAHGIKSTEIGSEGHQSLIANPMVSDLGDVE